MDGTRRASVLKGRWLMFWHWLKMFCAGGPICCWETYQARKVRSPPEMRLLVLGSILGLLLFVASIGVGSKIIPIFEAHNVRASIVIGIVGFVWQLGVCRLHRFFEYARQDKSRHIEEWANTEEIMKRAGLPPKSPGRRRNEVVETTSQSR